MIVITTAQLKSTIINEKTDLVCRRWYYVERLKKSVKSLITLCVEHKKYILPLELPIDIRVTDPMVQRCMIAIIEQKNIKPLVVLWQEIASYKYLYAVDLPGDFALLLCIILQHVCLVLHDHGLYNNICEHVQVSYEHLVEQDITDILSLVSRLTAYLHGATYSCVMSGRLSASLDTFHNIGAKDISLRFCLATRLKKTFTWLMLYKGKEIDIFKNIIQEDAMGVTVDHHIMLRHPRLIMCCKEMAQTKSVVPFIALWKQFRHFEEIRDVQFLKDFLKLVLATCHYFFLANSIKKPGIALASESWPEHVDDYSVLQMLQMLDEIELVHDPRRSFLYCDQNSYWKYIHALYQVIQNRLGYIVGGKELV
jgi:hypothetical protein